MVSRITGRTEAIGTSLLPRQRLQQFSGPAHDGGNIQVIHKTAFSNQAITFGNWRWVIYARV